MNNPTGDQDKVSSDESTHKRAQDAIHLFEGSRCPAMPESAHRAAEALIDELRRQGIALEAKTTDSPAKERDTVIFLWQLLDDIDTYDDMCKGDDKFYRAKVRSAHERRWETGIKTDGYNLIMPYGETIYKAEAARAMVFNLKPDPIAKPENTRTRLDRLKDKLAIMTKCYHHFSQGNFASGCDYCGADTDEITKIRAGRPYDIFWVTWLPALSPTEKRPDNPTTGADEPATIDYQEATRACMAELKYLRDAIRAMTEAHEKEEHDFDEIAGAILLDIIDDPERPPLSENRIPRLRIDRRQKPWAEGDGAGKRYFQRRRSQNQRVDKVAYALDGRIGALSIRVSLCEQKNQAMDRCPAAVIDRIETIDDRVGRIEDTQRIERGRLSDARARIEVLESWNPALIDKLQESVHQLTELHHSQRKRMGVLEDRADNHHECMKQHSGLLHEQAVNDHAERRPAVNVLRQDVAELKKQMQMLLLGPGLVEKNEVDEHAERVDSDAGSGRRKCLEMFYDFLDSRSESIHEGSKFDLTYVTKELMELLETRMKIAWLDDKQAEDESVDLDHPEAVLSTLNFPKHLLEGETEHDIICQFKAGDRFDIPTLRKRLLESIDLKESDFHKAEAPAEPDPETTPMPDESPPHTGDVDTNGNVFAAYCEFYPYDPKKNVEFKEWVSPEVHAAIGKGYKPYLFSEDHKPGGSAKPLYVPFATGIPQDQPEDVKPGAWKTRQEYEASDQFKGLYGPDRREKDRTLGTMERERRYDPKMGPPDPPRTHNMVG